MTMFSDKLIRTMLDESRVSMGVQPLAWVPEERLQDYGPIDDSQIQPASFDVRLGGDFIRHPSGEYVGLDPWYCYRMEPGECLLATLVERVSIGDNIVARIEGKSSWARKFLTVHSAGFIDPGFTGDITLELKNDGQLPIDLKPGMRIAQLSFQWLTTPAVRPYGAEGLDSHYQGQTGATVAATD